MGGQAPLAVADIWMHIPMWIPVSSQAHSGNCAPPQALLYSSSEKHHWTAWLSSMLITFLWIMKSSWFWSSLPRAVGCYILCSLPFEWGTESSPVFFMSYLFSTVCLLTAWLPPQRHRPWATLRASSFWSQEIYKELEKDCMPHLRIRPWRTQLPYLRWGYVRINTSHGHDSCPESSL